MLDNLTKCVDVDCVKRFSEDVAKNAADAAERARGAVEDLSSRVKDDYLPRAQVATDAAFKAVSGEGSVQERLERASKGVKSAMENKKKCPVKHPWLLSFVLAATAAAVGFVVYTRTRPVEDPWAEESWEDIDDEDLVIVADQEV